MHRNVVILAKQEIFQKSGHFVDDFIRVVLKIGFISINESFHGNHHATHFHLPWCPHGPAAGCGSSCMSAERKHGWMLRGEPDVTWSPVLFQGQWALLVRLSYSQSWKIVTFVSPRQPWLINANNEDKGIMGNWNPQEISKLIFSRWFLSLPINSVYQSCWPWRKMDWFAFYPSQLLSTSVSVWEKGKRQGWLSGQIKTRNSCLGFSTIWVLGSWVIRSGLFFACLLLCLLWYTV